MGEVKEKILTLIHKECGKLENMAAVDLLQDVIDDCQRESDERLRMEYMTIELLDEDETFNN